MTEDQPKLPKGFKPIPEAPWDWPPKDAKKRTTKKPRK